MTFVKICGITNLDDALAAQAFGADMIGINFYEGSKRFVSVTSAVAMFGDLQAIRKIGVFVNAGIEDIVNAIGQVKLDAVQLHGNENAEFIGTLRKRTAAEIIKAVRVRSAEDIEHLKWFRADSILLDAFSEKEFGGTGEVFDWQIALLAMEKVENVYLAGGLIADNVAEAIRTVRPFAVDVASGVESVPGNKDHTKMEAFITNAKSA
jgi:phosphoribosylanthranilate isomerase